MREDKGFLWPPLCCVAQDSQRKAVTKRQNLPNNTPTSQSSPRARTPGQFIPPYQMKSIRPKTSYTMQITSNRRKGKSAHNEIARQIACKTLTRALTRGRVVDLSSMN